MYVAACSFDKTIRMFDFFSGELVAQVAGHSDMITGVRFSPDGKRLFTIGGDGCIIIWKLGSSIVAAMRDRLMELYSSAQRKSQRVHESQSDLITIPPPPPATMPAHESPEPNANSVDQSTDGDRTGKSIQESFVVVGSQAPIEMPEPEIDHDDSHSAPNEGNPWAAKVAEVGGYELFGQKFLGRDVQLRKERNKFTAQLTAALDTRVSMADEGNVIRLAEPLEAADDVNLGSDDGNDETMFKGNALPDEEYIELDPTERDYDLENASSKLDTLELSVGRLENCLEDKV